MRGRSLLALTVTAAWVLACGGFAGIDDDDDDLEGPGGLEPGRIHVSYPTAALQAAPGQFVLAPARDALERAVTDGAGTFEYAGAELVEVGEVESTVRTLAGAEFAIPNTLIIPIAADYAAHPGDVLLAHWDSGSGMRRAFVTGGTATAPTVRYLDRAYDEATADEQADDTLQPGHFHALTNNWQIGATVACGEGDERDHGVLVHDAGEQILVLGFANELASRSRSECVSLPPRQRFAEGDAVRVPVVGAYTEGTVTRFDRDVGRVWVKYVWGGSEKEEAFPIVDVTTSFDGLEEPLEGRAERNERRDAARDEAASEDPPRERARDGERRDGERRGDGRRGGARGDGDGRRGGQRDGDGRPRHR